MSGGSGDDSLFDHLIRAQQQCRRKLEVLAVSRLMTSGRGPEQPNARDLPGEEPRESACGTIARRSAASNGRQARLAVHQIG